jgi:hypothetical protein
VVVWDLDDGGFVQTRNFGLSVNAWQIAGTGEFDLA